MPDSELPEVPPETKDWTWVLHERCPQCTLEAGVLTLAEIPAVIRAQVQVWPVVLLRGDVLDRPAQQVWSPLEYAAHTRDVLRLFTDRLALIRAEDEPTFADWDPNEAALAGGYHELDPETVGAEILASAETLAAAVEAVPPESAGRRGLRSDGAAFTVTTLMQYLVHDLVHHLWDVSGEPPGASAGATDGSDSLPEALQDTRPRAEVLQEAGAAEQVLDGGTSGGEATSPGVVAEQSEVGAGSPEVAAPQEPAPGAAGGASAEAPESGEVPEPPIQAFANRHRRVLGLLVAIICAVLAVAYVTVVPPTVTGTGFRAFLVRWTVPACWALIAGVALTWALSLRRQIVNGFAYAAVACWVVYLVARLV
ncbi:DinB family protein [Ruania albidiflava]|uniref:DinB family protein n=1 Tax=Ruania albidiflava TaxID=366586 RepID=UPI0003B2E636|nr:DinB family protein [Ruania albidiflava]